jgi:acyl-CoA dehydrogenase
MNLDFSDDQKLLQEEAKKFLTKEDALKINRAVMDSDKTYDQELWNKIVGLGWTGIRIPEEYQGLGLSHLELCVIAEELGRQVAPVPFSSSVYLFTETLIEFGSEEQKNSILPKLVTGDVIGTLAIAETNSAPSKDNISVALKDGKLSGTKIAVPDAEVATHAVVVAKNGDNVSLCVVDLNSDDVDITVQRNIDESRGYYSVSFNGANAEIIGDEESGWSNLEKIMDHAAVLFSFEQIGGAQASLDMANKYAKERYAFGRPIGSFQSMKHKLADMYVALTLAKSNSFMEHGLCLQMQLNFRQLLLQQEFLQPKHSSYVLKKISKHMAVMVLRGNMTVICFIKDQKCFHLTWVRCPHGAKNLLKA